MVQGGTLKIIIMLGICTKKGCDAEIDLTETMEGKGSKAILQVTSDGQICDIPSDSLECTLESEITRTREKCEVRSSRNH